MSLMTITVPGKPALTTEEVWAQKAQEFLDQLPNTQVALTDFFYDTETFGERNDGGDCPLANYLAAQMAPFNVRNVWVAHHIVFLNDATPGTRPTLAHTDHHQVMVALPVHCREFIEGMDAGGDLYNRLHRRVREV